MRKDIAADGLRGMASLAVFFAHFLLPFYPVAFEPWFPGVSVSGSPSSSVEVILSVPVLSTLWNGSFAVSVFFVLSGFVLCKRYVDTGDAGVVRSMASRRYLRLGLPVAASVFFAWALGKATPDVIEQVSTATGSAWLRGNSLAGLGFLDALKDAAYGVLLEGSNRFNTVFWTMRVELIGSFLVFAYTLLSGSRRQTVIVALTVLLIVVVGAAPGWPHFLAFLLGAFFAQSGLKASSWVGWPLIIAGLYLGGYSSSVIYSPFDRLGVPADSLKWILSTAGAALVFLAVRGDTARSLLASKFSQFLGRISYSLYLVHAPIIIGVGCPVFWWAVSEVGFGRSVAVGIALVVSLPASVLVAAAFEKFIDRKAILWGRRLVVGGERGTVVRSGSAPVR